MWTLRRPHLQLDEGNYKQEENAKPEPLRRRKKARRRANSFIDAEVGVNGDASSDEITDEDNNDLAKFIVTDDIEF